MRSNYGEELKRLLRQRFQWYFSQATQRKDFHPNCPHSQLAIIQRYHCQAILSMLETWTEQDTRQLDEIVHTVYHMLTADIPPWDGQPASAKV